MDSATRVYQLDSAELDEELDSLFWEQLLEVCEAFRVSVATWSNELRLALRGFLWYYSIWKTDSTFGQDMLDLHYKHANGSSVNRLQAMLHGFFTVVLPYLQEKLPLSNHVNSPKIAQLIEDAAWMLHFYWFLVRGGFRSWTERLLRLRAVHSEAPSLSSIDFQYMNREMLWHGFADILIYVLPLINYRRFYFFARKQWFNWKQRNRKQQFSGENQIKPVIFTRASLNRCCYCLTDTPILPQSIGCSHVMCYSCAMGLLECHGLCPVCDSEIVVVNPIDEIK